MSVSTEDKAGAGRGQECHWSEEMGCSALGYMCVNVCVFAYLFHTLAIRVRAGCGGIKVYFTTRCGASRGLGDVCGREHGKLSCSLQNTRLYVWPALN